jgi:geranylgeranyl pyrophosphate synthase
MNETIAIYLNEKSSLIEDELERLVPPGNCPHSLLHESARYALLGGGKRLRPILTLTVTEIMGGNITTALSPACAIEMIHTYSMIHDDLPCMDNDDFRRGKLTVHKKYSEGVAVLAGDFLLTYAFEVLAKNDHLPPLVKSQLIQTLAHRSGSQGMIGGQAMDITFEGKQISLETLQLLHRNKTAALLTASIEFGAIISNTPPHFHKHLQQFGECIGLAFQIVDDILDVTSSQVKHGKEIASDVLNEKSTYVSLLGLEKAKSCANEFYEKALQALNSLPYETSRLAAIADYILQRER